MRFGIIVLILLSFIFPVSSLAEINNYLCSPKGHTVLIINGMNTDEEKAKTNKDVLEILLSPKYNNEPLIVDYLHNPSHIFGVGDVFNVAYQKLFETEAVGDYDLTEMIKDANCPPMTSKVVVPDELV